MINSALMKFLRWLVYALIKLGLGIICRIDGEDMRKIPARGPLILYSNHTGALEVPVLYELLYPRPATGWAKVESWDKPFLNWLFSLWNIIPVRRGEVDMSALRRALQALDAGYIFGLAPEGTRSRTGRLIRARAGAVTLATLSGAPLYPLAHWGGEKFISNLRKLKRTDFHLRVGEPFVIDTDGGRISGELRQQIADEMMVRLALLMPPEYRGEYSDAQPAGKFLKPLAPQGPQPGNL
jgi:1-acyl-sn-glycerol-3-phosphate acyltransferase